MLTISLTIFRKSKSALQHKIFKLLLKEFKKSLMASSACTIKLCSRICVADTEDDQSICCVPVSSFALPVTIYRYVKQVSF
jgi:hypothetical protein